MPSLCRWIFVDVWFSPTYRVRPECRGLLALRASRDSPAWRDSLALREIRETQALRDPEVSRETG